MSDSYHRRRKADHRAWLAGFKQRCSSCGETRTHKLTILDAETGAGLGLSEGGWSIPPKRRDEAAEHAIVLCHSCGYRYRRERGLESVAENASDPLQRGWARKQLQMNEGGEQDAQVS